MFRVSRNQIIWGGNYFSLPPTRCFLVWRKTNIAEDFTMAMAEYAWTSFNSNAKIFSCSSLRTDASGKFHPTEKRIELYRWILERYAKPGYKIFDPNMGSQNSRIADYLMDYDYWGCEIDKYYFDEGCKNFERLPATPEMHRILADEYAKARGFDPQQCFELMQAYRSTQPGKIDNLY